MKKFSKKKSLRTLLTTGKKYSSFFIYFFLSTHFFCNAQSVKVYIFFSPDCPICISYARKINQLCKLYSNQIEFKAIFPGKDYSENDINSFYKKYDFLPSKIMDENKDSVIKYKATITPQVFILQNQKVVYSGAIDDQFVDLGKKKTKASKLFLETSLALISSNKPLIYQNTKAIGCFIE